ncbi:MAG: DUF4190 domain-containing protein [Chloroflexales bacterium]|nr:DUF4190 domain-containing protein [Chloroflexales bacterium]
MICQRCGATNDEGQFCYNCGVRLEQAPVTKASSTPPVATNPTPLPEQDFNQIGASQPYPIQYANYAPVARPNSTMAQLSLIFGIVGWVLVPILGPIGAVICGHMARNEIRRSDGRIGGEGLAIAGLVLGYAQLIIVVLGICTMIAFLAFVAAIV